MPFWSVWLVCATAVHAGFQLTVTVLVYPALVRVAADDFAREHRRHSGAIVPLVGVVYGGVVVACVGAGATDPRSIWVWVTISATALALLVTAGRAAPLHRELGRRGPGPDLLRRLVRADRTRTYAALLAAVAAVLHAL